MFCRLRTRPLLGSVRGHYSLPQKLVSLWLPVLPDGAWYLGISTTVLNGGAVIGLVFSHLVLFLPVVATFTCFDYPFLAPSKLVLDRESFRLFAK